jgi:hypothetical protein
MFTSRFLRPGKRQEPGIIKNSFPEFQETTQGYRLHQPGIALPIFNHHLSLLIRFKSPEQP